MFNSQDAAALIGRLLLAAMFLMAGLNKFAGLEGTAGYIASAGLPMPSLLAVVTAVLEVGGGVMLILGWQTRWAALALAAFTLLASVLFHNFWVQPVGQQMVQQLFFMKNLAIVGGLLVVYAFGPGGLSVEGLRGSTAKLSRV